MIAQCERRRPQLAASARPQVGHMVGQVKPCMSGWIVYEVTFSLDGQDRRFVGWFSREQDADIVASKIGRQQWS